jgi:hypothetical protein
MVRVDEVRVYSIAEGRAQQGPLEGLSLPERMILGNPRLLAPASSEHRAASVLAIVEHFITRAADLRTREQSIYLEDELPSEDVRLERRCW